jgi:RNA polymerase sigma-70 factor (ECF subfamily)
LRLTQHLDDAEDHELVAAIGGGDDAAMAVIMRRHREPVVAFARRLVGDRARAEEVGQEVFLRLWQRSDRYDPARGSLRAFLLATTHGRALDTLRSERARTRREARGTARPEQEMQGADSPVVARTVADAVRRALADLPEAERRAVELAYLGGHSYRTVAAMLGAPEGTVKSRIRHGLARLRTALAAQDLQGA